MYHAQQKKNLKKMCKRIAINVNVHAIFDLRTFFLVSFRDFPFRFLSLANMKIDLGRKSLNNNYTKWKVHSIQWRFSG